MTRDPSDYLAADEVIDWTSEPVLALAATLGADGRSDVAYARACYEWVRDEVAHSVDAADPRVSVSATDTLRQRVGLCYAKSHLLVALLRARGIPAGLCYQSLQDDAGGFVVHGLVAVRLRDGWHRQDPRGNKPGIDAQFSVSRERLAWRVDPTAGEIDYPDVYATAHPSVLAALRDATNVLDARLPDRLGAHGEVAPPAPRSHRNAG